MEYNFNAIEKKWQEQWKKDKAYKVEIDTEKPKCYVLDMFPYPSGAGLHVGHPLGYIASDIYSRYKRLKGFNVLHPMGFDSFGLPAEQYALESGQHPADTTEKNIETFKAQLDKIGFCYDWDREIRTSDPAYYKWTQDIFLKLFEHYFCNTQKKARPISDLIKKYELKGCVHFTAEEWNGFSEKVKADWLMKRRLAYVSYGEVNWCEALGTVLANDEVVNGVSERGGHPVEKKKMRQWYLRITAYAERLLAGLNTVQFSESMKDMQRNWIGKSEGAELSFIIDETESIKVYTTRPDTIFGVDFLVLAPEHELVKKITTADQQKEIEDYLHYVKSRSDRERMAEVKQITGCFTGAYATNPFDGKLIPIWIAEYVLSGYGTGAIMAVPCGDQRDFGFAKYFNIPITNIIGEHYTGEEANPTKEAVLQNSGFLNGMTMRDAIPFAMDKIEALGIGKRKINFRMRDAGFSRQRYWGEPFPIIWKDGIAIPLKEKDLPLELPRVEKYGPGPDGEGPLANITDWVNVDSLAHHHMDITDASLLFNFMPPDLLSGTSLPYMAAIENVLANEENADNRKPDAKRETSTMPGYAGSSWYFLRYMDPHNTEAFCDKEKSDYWQQVDLYIGGTEHAVGHLLYSRMWTKFLYDLELISFDEPFKKLVNQGMITGSSRFYYVMSFTGYNVIDDIEVPFISEPFLVSYDLIKNYDQGQNMTANELCNELCKFNSRIAEIIKIYKISGSTSTNHRVNVNIVDGELLDIQRFLSAKQEYLGIDIIYDKSVGFTCRSEVEKMSKSKLNSVNPDQIVEKYGADTFRMYEMFLGPVEMSKPWDTKGIEGVHRFLRKLWRLFFDDIKGPIWNEEKPTAAELKTLHKTIKKIESDTETFSYNTAVSAFMVCVNELSDLKCHKKEILQPLLVLLSPYAPHIAEELWHAISAPSSVLVASYPVLDESHLAESTKDYPVSINGKMRTTITLPSDVSAADAEAAALGNEVVQKWLEGKATKKVIFVKGKMVNVVI